MTALAARRPAGHYRFRHLAHMELIKLRTLRSTWWTLAVSAAGAVAIGVAVGLNTRSGTEDLTNNALAGLIPALLLSGVLGALLMTSEYSSGMIRSTLAALLGGRCCWPPRRRCSEPWRWRSGRRRRSSPSSRAAQPCATASRRPR